MGRLESGNIREVGAELTGEMVGGKEEEEEPPH